MKITNDGVSQASVNAAQAAPGAASSSRDAAPAGVAPQGDAYTPSTDLLRLVGLVKQQPEVRADRVREVAQKLQTGAYSSFDSAQKTADAMLQSID